MTRAKRSLIIPPITLTHRQRPVVRRTLEFGGVSVNSTVLQLTQSKIPAPRKHFQLPSGSFL